MNSIDIEFNLVKAIQFLVQAKIDCDKHRSESTIAEVIDARNLLLKAIHSYRRQILKDAGVVINPPN